MLRAQRLLGRHYSISGRVVHGEGLGRKLGCPTANVLMKHNRPPLSGIFAVEVHGIDACVLPGVASLDKCRVRKSGLSYLVDIQIRVHGTLSVREGHAIAHAVKNELLASPLLVSDVSVHVEPV